VDFYLGLLVSGKLTISSDVKDTLFYWLDY